MNASALAATAAPPPSLAVLAGQAGDGPLTRVSLAYVEQRINLYLRFGEPARIVRRDRWRRVAVFLPGALFCRIRWQANDYGTIRCGYTGYSTFEQADAKDKQPVVGTGLEFKF